MTPSLSLDLPLESVALVGAPRDRRGKIIWTIGNFLMLVGIVTLCYVGGLYSTDAYGQYAARGDTDTPPPVAVALPAEDAAAEPAPFVAPLLTATTNAEDLVASAAPSPEAAEHRATVTRVAIPSIGIDAKVIEVGWEEVTQGGGTSAVWQVAKYAVGQHRGSANPGEGSNIVLAGHVGGYGKVFKDLYNVQPGDQIMLYSGGTRYLYTVQQRLLVTETGVSAEQHTQNAQLIAPTDHEQITLITCWPPSGPKRFTQRVIVQATPFLTAAPVPTQSRWSAR